MIGISLEEDVRAVANVPFESRGYSSTCLSQGETAHVSAFVDGVVRFLQVQHLSCTPMLRAGDWRLSDPREK